MSNVGFKGFRRPETIPADVLAASMKRLGVEGRYIFWTGNSYRGRAQSLRSNALRCVDRKNTAIPFKSWLEKVARSVNDTTGYSPERAVEGLYLHAGAKPAVYYELAKNAKGDYIAVRDSLYADPTRYPKGIKRGDVIISAKVRVEGKTLPKGKGKPAQIGGPTPPVTPPVTATGDGELNA